MKELLSLFLPISLVSFSYCIFLFIEKLLLAQLSSEILEAAVSASYVIMIFQGPCVAIVMMAQVFVARYLGENESKQIGSVIWQYLWFSLFSLVFVVPGTIIFSNYYFQGTAVNEVVYPYLYFLAATSFVFPLTSTLSCFYLGMGKTRLLLYGTLAAQTAKLFLAYLLIFGVENYLPALGIMGGAMSTFIAQSGYCLLLLIIFLRKDNRKTFHTFEWKLNSEKFWLCIQPGLLRAFNRILNFISWSAIAHLMVAKGGSYALIMSIGGTYFMFLPFVGEAICNAQITIVSRILGAKKYPLLNQSLRSGLLLSLFFAILFAIPLLVFPEIVYDFLFPKVEIPYESISIISFGIWLSFTFYTLTMLMVSYILAFKDMNFSFFMGIFGWFNGFLPMYVAINYVAIHADQFWTFLSVMHASTALMYYLRMKTLQANFEPKITAIKASNAGSA